MINILLLADGKETSHYGVARSSLNGISCHLPKAHNLSYGFYSKAAKLANCSHIVTCSDYILKQILTVQGKETKGNVNQWAGAILELDGVKWIITKPFSHIRTTMTGEFIFKRHVMKHLLGNNYKIPAMEWCNISGTGHPENLTELYSIVDKAILCAVDIETKRLPISELAVDRCSKPEGIAAWMPLTKGSKKLHHCAPMITMVGYYFIYMEAGKLTGKAFVLNLQTMEDIHLMRKLNQVKTPKVMQNGGYDCTYFIRYGAPVYNYLYDTYHFFHCWYSELPRKLDFLTSWFLPNYEYWKDEIDDDVEEYNAKDVYNTAWVMILMLLEAPEWVTNNYLIKFRKLFPNMSMGLEGLRVDELERNKLLSEYQDKAEKARARLSKIVGVGFNPKSPPQTLALMNCLSHLTYKSSDKFDLRKWSEEASLHEIIYSLIKEVRELEKAISTYITSRLFSGRLLYEINPSGTETGRSASKSSNLWVGTQIQNQDSDLRSMYIADEGYELASLDNSQSESRCTAYISEDMNLIDTVETAKDFHCRNTALFFGITEDEVVKPVYATEVIDGVEIQRPKLDAKGKPILDKSLRDIGKRVNHGANYNMGESVLIQTMGRKEVMKAGRLLGLPKTWSAFRIATFLLEAFDKAYPKVRSKYYSEVIQEILTTRMLKLPNGWIRFCIGTPSFERSAKMLLNKYVAHKPQSLSVMMIDDALFDFWIEYQIKRNQVRLKAQVHDEILFQQKPEFREENMAALSELMRRPIEVNGRTMIIPNDGGTYGSRWSEL